MSAAGATARRAPAGTLPLPVVRPPEPTPAWIGARAPKNPVPLTRPEAVTPGGVEEGYAEGLRRAEQTLLAERQSVAAALTAVAALREQILRESEPQIVDLTLAVAKELVLRSMERDRDLAARLAAAALDELGRCARIVLRVSAADRESIDGWLGALPRDPSRPAPALVEDPSLGMGEVIAETDMGKVDARLENRLAQIVRALREGEPTP